MIDCQDHPSNNVIERFFSTFKPRYHLFRGFKSFKRAQEFLDVWAFYYNDLRPHKRVQEKPPAGDYWGGTIGRQSSTGGAEGGGNENRKCFSHSIKT